jgi:transposase-like protein
MPRSPNSKDLPLSTRLEIVLSLSDMVISGKLPRGAISEAATRFDCHRNTVYKLWSGRATITVPPQSNRGRPRSITEGELKAKIEAAPLESLRDLAASTGSPVRSSFGA